MNYFDLIPLIEREVVTDGLWSSDTEKYSDLRNLLYAAAVTIGTDLPLSEFSLSTSTQSVANEVPENAPMPTDLFSYREDRGVRSIVIDGTRYMASQQNSYQAVMSLAENTLFLEDTDVAFNIDMGSKKVYGVNLGPDIDIEYLAMFPEPADTGSGLQSEEFPLPPRNRQEAINQVAAHLSGNRKRDEGGAQFNMILTNLYGGRNDG